MRTRTSLSVICLSAALALGGVAHAARPASYKELKYPPIHDIKVPDATRFELPNGMVVFLIEDHELPKANIHVTVRAGSRWDPASKAGLAAIMGTVMRTGGSVTRSGDQLDEELDRLGASIETGMNQDSGGAFASLLKEDLDRGIDIVADIIQHPAFPQDKLDLAKIEQRDAIARRNDNPNGIAFREFAKLLYGKDSPYARQTEYATIEAITRDDLIRSTASSSSRRTRF
jgi:zinc protease